MNELWGRACLELAKMFQDLKTNRRLQWALVLSVLILAVYVLLELQDAIVERERTLADLRTEIAKIRDVGRNSDALVHTAAELARNREKLESRLGGFATEAVAQAAMLEWLDSIFLKAGLPKPQVSQVGIQPMSATPGNEQSSPQADTSEDMELNAVVSFGYSPESLLAVLEAVEGGQRLAYVYSLNVNASTRRIEMGVRQVTRIGDKWSGNELETTAMSAPLASASASQAASALEKTPSVSSSSPIQPRLDKIRW